MSKSSVQNQDVGGDEAAVEDARAYNNFVSASVDLSNPHVSPDGNMLSVTRTVRDIDANLKRKYIYQIPIPEYGASDSLAVIPPTQMSSDIRAQIPSPSGDKMAVLKEEEKDKTKQVMEIWTRGCQCLSRRILLPKIHGKVCHDPAWFGKASWNPQETALVYSAERKEPTTRSFFDTDESAKSSGEPVTVGGQNTLGLGKGETWGEKYTENAALLDLYCVDIETGRVARVENVPGHNSSSTDSHGGYTLGQAVFSPCGTNVVYTAWDAGEGSNMPKRLGMIYCYQRPCQLYSSPVKELMERLKQGGTDSSKNDSKVLVYTCLTPNARLSRSPRFQSGARNSTAKLAFLSCKTGYDTHGGAISLYTMDWKVKDDLAIMGSHQELVKMVQLPTFQNGNGENQTPQQVANMTFPGLFLNQLPDTCFAPNNDFILTDTQWGSVQRIVRVSLIDQTLTLLNIKISKDELTTDEASIASQSFLCFTKNGGMLVCESAPNRPAVIGYVAPEAMTMEQHTALEKTVEARLLSEMAPVAATSFSGVEGNLKGTLGLDYEIVTVLAPTVPAAADTWLQCILLRPKATADGKKPPLIVVPHGGPHSCTATTFVPSYAYLCAHGGYAVLFVNYRGSTGFGMAALDSLPGNIGVVDVADVVHATRTVCESGMVDATRVGVCGGSHGGFIAGHCLGQFPDLFQAAAMRNPVTNVASMVSATDIPDWCYVEAFGGGCYNWQEFNGPTKEQLEVMWKASPVAHVSNVVSPTLIALGMSDNRVPPSQGLEFYHTLRSKGVKTKLLMYDKDDHAIDGVASEADHWINIKRWFDEMLN